MSYFPTDGPDEQQPKGAGGPGSFDARRNEDPTGSRQERSAQHFKLHPLADRKRGVEVVGEFFWPKIWCIMHYVMNPQKGGRMSLKDEQLAVGREGLVWSNGVEISVIIRDVRLKPHAITCGSSDGPSKPRSTSAGSAPRVRQCSRPRRRPA